MNILIALASCVLIYIIGVPFVEWVERMEQRIKDYEDLDGK